MAFVVIEGIDGSGKSTQIRLLREYLDKSGIIFKYIHFPRTGEGLLGDLIARFLRGELGKIDEVNPYLVSLIYAADRHNAKGEMMDWLSKGNLLLVDRYVMSNVAFQCAKLKTPAQKKNLREWIIQLEYVNYGIPKPDLSLFLDVPSEFTREKLGNQRIGNERDYLKGGQDIHEADLDFQQKVRQVYLEESGREENLRLISCFNEKKSMLKPEEIFTRIITLLKKEKILNSNNSQA